MASQNQNLTIEGYLVNWEKQVLASLRHHEPVSEDRARILAFMRCLHHADPAERDAILTWTARLMEQGIRNLGAVTAFEIIASLAVFLAKAESDKT